MSQDHCTFVIEFYFTIKVQNRKDIPEYSENLQNPKLTAHIPQLP